jgi:serine/threonine-protein kinase
LSQTDPLIGRRVRDLQIAERIGRGGMGAVYRAEHQLLREPRAVKVIRAELFNAVPEAVERFEREARIAVRLRHPNLVLVHDFFVEAGDHFLVMEYVVGRSLGELLRERGPFEIEEICRIGAQCCAGLAHAHDLGIVHRDLSPENVMLTGSSDGPTAKIIDFGVARAALAASDTTRGGADAALTRVGDFIGKPRYASPEQAGALRHGEELDGRSDLYALGLVLYELVTGLPPFQSESAVGRFGLAYTSQDDGCIGVVPKALDDFQKIGAGKRVTGNICYEVLSDDAGALRLRHRLSPKSAPVFFKLH